MKKLKQAANETIVQQLVLWYALRTRHREVTTFILNPIQNENGPAIDDKTTDQSKLRTVQAETAFEAASTSTADNKVVYNSTGSPVFAFKARTYPRLRIGHSSNSLSLRKHSVQHRYGKHRPKSRANVDQISWLAWFTNWAKSVFLCRNISQMTSSPRTPYRPTIAGVLPFSVWLRGNSAPSCIIFVFVYYLL